MPEQEWPVGRTVVKVRPLTAKELARESWTVSRLERAFGAGPFAIEFDDGTIIYASCDSEGNGPGAMFGVDPDGKQIMLIGPSPQLSTFKGAASANSSRP